jgi:hypothetical protein
MFLISEIGKNNIFLLNITEIGKEFIWKGINISI